MAAVPVTAQAGPTTEPPPGLGNAIAGGIRQNFSLFDCDTGRSRIERDGTIVLEGRVLLDPAQVWWWNGRFIVTTYDDRGTRSYDLDDYQLRSLAAVLLRWGEFKPAREMRRRIGELMASRDAFNGVPECERLAAVPSGDVPGLDGALRMLGPCMDAVTRKYSAKSAAQTFSVEAVKGPVGVEQEPGIVLQIRGEVPDGVPLLRSLRRALINRNSVLLGHPARTGD